MAKAKAKKKTEVSKEMQKAVFLHGNPNVEKGKLLSQLQSVYTDAVNQYLSLMNRNPSILLPVLMNNKKDSVIRAFEKENRINGLGSVYSQNAFDDAVSLLHNREMDIKAEVVHTTGSLLAKVTTLYYCVLTGKSRAEMNVMLSAIRDSYQKEDKIAQYQSIIDQLGELSDDEFSFQYENVLYNAGIAGNLFKFPRVSKADVSLNKNVAKLEPATTAKCSYVLTLTIPPVISPTESAGYKISVPLYTSENSIRRMNQYKTSLGITYTIKANGKIRVSVCCTKKPNLLDKDKITKVNGVDVGISDAFHVSTGVAIGSFSECIKFYKDIAEPLLGQISSMRNKKRQLKRYLKKHKNTLPENVVKEIRDHMDRIEYAIRHSTKAYHRANRYHNMVEHEARKAVDDYIKLLNGNKEILTAIELLDIKEFNKSRFQNGRYSMFARGLLSSKLMSSLNWHGYHFVQVEPAYTSQVCPNCYNLNKKNRNGKNFVCTCCGFHDDADHVGSVNIESRATDDEISAVCEKNKYNKEARHAGIREVFAGRHEAWKQAAHPNEIHSPSKKDSLSAA